MSKVERQREQSIAIDEIDLRALLSVLRSSKRFVLSITGAVSLFALVFALLLPDVYKAEALLAPNHEERSGGISRIAAQYGGLASLAGIDLGQSSQDKTTLGLEILTSRKFISEFVDRRNILVPLMATKSWNRESDTVEIDAALYDVDSNQWVRKVRAPRKTIPSFQEAYERFLELLEVREDKETGFILLSISHHSPSVAKSWVDWLVEDLNMTIMRHDVGEAEQAIDYLSAQIEATSLAELRSVFFSLIEEQTKTVMLASVTDEYLFKTIDPAVIPERIESPNRLLLFGSGVFAGVLLGLMFVAMRDRSQY